MTNSELTMSTYRSAGSIAEKWINSLPLIAKQRFPQSEPKQNKKPRIRKPHVRISELPPHKLRPTGSEPKAPKSHRRISIWERVYSRSLEELTRDIKITRDKAYDGDKLSEYEEFLFNAFLNGGAVSIEQMAKTLKNKAERKLHKLSSKELPNQNYPPADD